MVNSGPPILTMFPVFPALGLAALVVLALALLHACRTDLRERRIANGACLTVALAALPFQIAVGEGDARALVEPLLILLGSIVPLLLIWRAGLLGGGDIKLLAALMLWMTDKTWPVLLLVMAMAGGALGVGIALACRLRGQACRLGVPYGLSIALGALAALALSTLRLAGQVG